MLIFGNTDGQCEIELCITLFWVDIKLEIAKGIEINWSVLSGGVVCFLNIHLKENVQSFGESN